MHKLVLQDVLKSRVQERSGTHPTGAYRQQRERLAKEGASFTRDVEAEKVILQKWDVAFLYAKYVLQDVWPEFEDQLNESNPARDLGSIRAAYNYANDVRGMPLVGAEKHIANDGTLAADYAINVLGGPWSSENTVHARALLSIGADAEASRTYERAMEHIQGWQRKHG